MSTSIFQMLEQKIPEFRALMAGQPKKSKWTDILKLDFANLWLIEAELFDHTPIWCLGLRPSIEFFCGRSAQRPQAQCLSWASVACLSLMTGFQQLLHRQLRLQRHRQSQCGRAIWRNPCGTRSLAHLETAKQDDKGDTKRSTKWSVDGEARPVFEIEHTHAKGAT